MSKSLFASKTFWFNILSTAAEVAQMVSGLHIVPPGTLVIVSNVINIGLRLVTTQPTHVVSPQ